MLCDMIVYSIVCSYKTCNEVGASLLPPVFTAYIHQHLIKDSQSTQSCHIVCDLTAGTHAANTAN